MQIPSSCSSLQCPALEPRRLLGPSNTEKRGINRQPFPLGSINKHGYFSPVLPTLVISNCLSAKAVPFCMLQTFPITLNYLPSLPSATVRAVANSITPHLRECTDEDGPCLKSSGCRQRCPRVFFCAQPIIFSPSLRHSPLWVAEVARKSGVVGWGVPGEERAQLPHPTSPLHLIAPSPSLGPCTRSPSPSSHTEAHTEISSAAICQAPSRFLMAEQK